METVFDIGSIGLVIPVIFVSVCAVLVFVFGFKKPNPLPEFDKKLDLTESNKSRPKKDKLAQNGDVKKVKKAAAVPEKKKEQKQQDDKKKAKKTETAAPAPKQSAKAKKAEEYAQRKAEIKEYREMEQDGGDWNVVVSKKKTNKSEDAPATPANEKPSKKKEKGAAKDNAKDIKDRVNNELKNEETIKMVISEIKEEISQPQAAAKKKRARHD